MISVERSVVVDRQQGKTLHPPFPIDISFCKAAGFLRDLTQLHRI